MNTAPESTLDSALHPDSVPPSPAPTLHSALFTLNSLGRRRNGKVASLPKLERDLVNRMLEDSAPYNNIAAALAQLGHSVSARNISNWYQAGHQDWLLQQQRLDSNRLREEAVLDVLDGDHALDLPAAGLQVAATHLCQLLLAARSENDDPESGLNHYIRAANSLCRISRQLFQIQRLRDEAALDSAEDDASDNEPRPSLESLLETFSPAQPSDIAADSSSEVESSKFEVQGSKFNFQAAATSPAPTPDHEPPPSSLALLTPLSPPLPTENTPAPSFKVQSSKLKVQGSDNSHPSIPPSANPTIHQSINPQSIHRIPVTHRNPQQP